MNTGSAGRPATGLVPSLSHSGGARGSRETNCLSPIADAAAIVICDAALSALAAILDGDPHSACQCQHQHTGTERERCRREDDSKGFFVSGPLPRSEWDINKTGADPYLWHYKFNTKSVATSLVASYRVA